MTSANPWHSAIVFLNILSSARDRHSANFFYFLKLILPRARPRHSANFFYFLETYFAECKPWALGNFFFNFLKLILPSASARHSVIFFIFKNHIWPETYPKYHEYQFLDDQSPLFHVPGVQIWNIQKNSTKRNKLMKYIKKSQNCPKF